jgi:hypothetical protein
MSEAATAKAILARIRKGEVQDGFAARDIRRREWSGLTDTGQIKAGLELLADYDWVALRTVETGGRPVLSTRSIRPLFDEFIFGAA